MKLQSARFPASHALIWLVVLLAGLLRLFRLQYGEYQLDDDSIWSAAVTAVAQRTLAIHGIQSTIGVANGPFQVYLMMPLAAISSSPFTGMVALALLNTAAVYFLYRFVAEFFGQRPALIAALLFAVNSWAVVYARHLSVQGMLVPFQVLFFWSVARWLWYGRGRDLILGFVWLAVLSQVYIVGLLHLATMAVVLGIGWRRLRAWPLLAGGAILAGLSFRYLSEVLADPRLLHPGGVAAIDLQSIVFLGVQALHTGFEGIAPLMSGVIHPIEGLEGAFLVLEIALLLAGAIYGLVLVVQSLRAGDSAKASVYGLLWIWLLVPVLLFVHHTEVLTPRHLALALPLPAVFSAFVLDRLWPRFGVPILAVVCANAVALAGVFFTVIPVCSGNNGYALPYQQTFELARSVEGLARAGSARAVFVDGSPSLAPVLSSTLNRAGLNALWSDTGHSPALGVPGGAAPAVYVTLDDSSGSGAFLRSSFAAQQVAEQAIPCEAMQFRGYLLRPEALRTALQDVLPESLALHASNGLDLQRITSERRLTPGETARFGVLWSWRGEQPRPATYTLFAHVLDKDGQMVGGSDRTLLPAAQWGVGQQVVQWLDIPLAAGLTPGRYSLELGFYDEHGVRLQLAGEGDAAIGTSILWGPLAIPPSPVSEGVFTPAAVQFGDSIELDGYRAAAAGLTLRWRALRRPDRDYTVFVHVLDGSGATVAQADSPPKGGDFPTGRWLPGDELSDFHPWALPAGNYRVQVGLYDLRTLQRLPGGPLEFELTAPPNT